MRHIYGTFCERAQSNLVPDFDTFWQKGWVEIPPRVPEYVLFAEFRADPENNPLRTPSGRIELYSDEIARFAYDDCPPHPAWIEPTEWLGGGQTTAFASEDADVHHKAQRFARLLIDEIKLYNQTKVNEGRKHKDLYDRLKDDIEKSRATYQKRYGNTPAGGADYFNQELTRSLAEDDISLLGGNFRR